jgi:hypothetical protein
MLSSVVRDKGAWLSVWLLMSGSTDWTLSVAMEVSGRGATREIGMGQVLAPFSSWKPRGDWCTGIIRGDNRSLEAGCGVYGHGLSEVTLAVESLFCGHSFFVMSGLAGMQAAFALSYE